MSADSVEALVDGTVVTLEVTVLSALLAAVIAVVMGTARLSGSRIVRLVAGAYIEVFRGTSVLVQLYFIYFALPFLGVYLSPLVAGVLALGLNTGSYGAEVVRGGVRAVPRGQTEAALTLGMGPWARFRKVIFPQALVVILPSAGTLLIDLLKLTSLVSLITLADLTFEAEQIRVETGETMQVFGVVLFIYFILASLIAAGFKRLERRAKRGLDPAASG